MAEARDARLHTLEACFGLALEAGSNTSSREFVGRALALASRQLGAARVSFIVPAEARGEWTFAGALGIGDSVLQGGAVTVRDNVLSEVLRSRAAVACASMDADRRFGANKKLRYKTKSFLVAPALVRGQVRCFFCATERDEGAFAEGDLGFAGDLVRIFAPIYELLVRGERAKERLLDEAELRRIRSAQDRLHARPAAFAGLDHAVLHHAAEGAR
ncbi:MAG: GAF domain-containing protein, partial [Spirochaetes bacterium]|nr:GAF domain-containing protein [Spirochaetota bacterium]